MMFGGVVLLTFKHQKKVELCSIQIIAQYKLCNAIKTFEIIHFCFSLSLMQENIHSVLISVANSRPAARHSVTEQVSACFTHSAPLRLHQFIKSPPAAPPVPRHMHTLPVEHTCARNALSLLLVTDAIIISIFSVYSVILLHEIIKYHTLFILTPKPTTFSTR